jgi:glycosyltransferase involved in cell wall biosynthesis
VQPLSFADQLWVTGVARNVGQHLDAVLANFDRLSNLYPDIHFSLFENDSDDDTRNRLQRWVADRPNAHLNIEDGLLERIKDRVDRIAYARNVALSAVNFHAAKMILNVDMDDVFSRPLETSSLVSAMNTITECDVVTANGYGGYYDIYALRIPQILEYDCWERYYWLVRTQGWNEKTATYEAIEQWKDFMPTVDRPLEVISAFNAAALYRADAFDGFLKYNTEDLLGRKVCEHVGLHERMIRNGKRIIFDPNFRV